jgi:transcription antitermination factor NusG
VRHGHQRNIDARRELIALDLDDGVKVNSGKFGDLLAEVKAVTGKKSD